MCGVIDCDKIIVIEVVIVHLIVMSSHARFVSTTVAIPSYRESALADDARPLWLCAFGGTGSPLVSALAWSAVPGASSNSRTYLSPVLPDASVATASVERCLS